MTRVHIYVYVHVSVRARVYAGWKRCMAMFTSTHVHIDTYKTQQQTTKTGRKDGNYAGRGHFHIDVAGGGCVCVCVCV
jgi:hypothetical protein